jgi:putative transcriptional regulator
VNRKNTPGRRIISAKEALRHARGEATGARVSVIAAPDVAAIRSKLGFTQEQFARRFGVSIGTLRNWEQGARAPDGPARVLLTVIDREPAAVKRALSGKTPAKPAAKRARAKVAPAKRRRV